MKKKFVILDFFAWIVGYNNKEEQHHQYCFIAQSLNIFWRQLINYKEPKFSAPPYLQIFSITEVT